MAVVLDMVIDTRERLHVVMGDGFVLNYEVFDPHTHQWETWLREERHYSANLAADSAGNVYLAHDMVVEGMNRVALTRIRPDGRWDEPILTPAMQGGSTTLMIDPLYGITMLAGYIDLFRGIPSNGESGTIRQSNLTIPATLPNPTLTFYYDLHRTVLDNPAHFSVTVSDGTTTTTTVLSDTATSGWTLGWADMSAWAGESVTVTFTLEQPTPPAPAAYLLLDTVSLTAWQTPVISTVSPAAVSIPYASATVTLTGMNFTAPLSAKVGTQPAVITRIDNETATLTLPPGLAVGRYEIDITNGVGLTYRRLAAVTIGGKLFLPLVRR